MDPIRLPCPTCHGDGFVSYGDRHVENRTEVCPTCHGHLTIPARTGETPETAAGAGTDAMLAGQPGA